jgi:hypothetical protein
MDVLHGHDLSPPRAHPLEGEDPLLERRGQAGDGASETTRLNIGRFLAAACDHVHALDLPVHLRRHEEG